MTFRARLTLVSAVAVAVAVALASGVLYVVVRGELRSEIDDSLVERGDQITRQLVSFRRPLFPVGAHIPAPRLGEAGGYVQFVRADGAVSRPDREFGVLPVTEAAVDVAAGRRDPFLADTSAGGTHLRVYTVSTGAGVAVQIARSLEEVDRTLRTLGLVLLLVALGGVALAAALGAFVARAALGPVRQLTEATEGIARTTDLGRRIPVAGSDELGRLGSSFNAMLEALEKSVAAQRQLIADVSHELRTPVTSVRTNLEVLARNGMSEEEVRPLVADVIEQLEEMTTLIGEVLDLARGEELDLEPEEIRLDELVAESVERAGRRAPNLRFRTDLRPSVVGGMRSRIARAVDNVLDNAAKWSPEGGEVEVRVADGVVTVRDHGPGIAAEELGRVFDRFYRAPSARGMPGSGLGLAIVRQVAEAHAGSVRAEAAPGGGTRVVLSLPPLPAEAPARS